MRLKLGTQNLQIWIQNLRPLASKSIKSQSKIGLQNEFVSKSLFEAIPEPKMEPKSVPNRIQIGFEIDLGPVYV